MNGALIIVNYKVIGPMFVATTVYFTLGQSMKKIVQMFGDDTVFNDSKVAWFVKTHFRVVLKQSNVGQCCKKLIQ